MTISVYSGSKMQSVARVLSLKRKLETDSEVAGFISSVPLIGADYSDFVAAVCDALGEVPYDAVYKSMFDLCGFELTKAEWCNTAWRLAANFETLKLGEPARKWTEQVSEEEVSVQVVESRARVAGKAKKRGYDFSFRVLTGTPASLLVTNFWTDAFCYVVADRIGFSKRGKYDLEHPTELVGTRLQVVIEPKLSSEHGPGFHKINPCGSANKAYNRRLIKKRRRIDFACPKKYTHECFRCPVGYKTCPAAVHPRDYTLSLCSKCGKKAWSDPKFLEIGVCVQCLAKM